MAANNTIQALWQTAFERCRRKLTAKDLANILQINTYDELTQSISVLRKSYKQRTVSRALNRLTPLLSNLQSFHGVIDTTVQANPEIAALIWGGIKLALEVRQPLRYRR